MTLRCISRYSNGHASWAAGEFAEGLSGEQEAALMADSPGSFEQVDVVRFIVEPGPDALAAKQAAIDAAVELGAWRRRWTNLCEVITAAGDDVGPDALDGWLREVLAGRGTLAEQVRALGDREAAQATQLAQQSERITALADSLAKLAPAEPKPADAKPARASKAHKDEAPPADAGEV